MVTEYDGIIIDWYDLKHDLLERDPEERMQVWECRGQDEFANEYVGSIEYCCDEIVQLYNIQKL